jgi:hypothetical protein
MSHEQIYDSVFSPITQRNGERHASRAAIAATVALLSIRKLSRDIAK